MSDAVDKAAQAAGEAAAELETRGRDGRAQLLEGLASALEDDGQAIVAEADRESALGAPRLTGELARTTFQLRFFADVIRDGGYLEAIIDQPGDTVMGPRPDLRRMFVPVGPVAVFEPSNFPLAFGVPGGDTASALAAGCPVVVKAHPSHTETSRRCFQAMGRAVAEQGLPVGVLGLVEGFDAGAELVQHPAIQAVGFTGSTTGGRALHDLAAARPQPIPFHGELGSLNPLVVTPGVVADRGEQIAAGYVGSMTLGLGQFCTKPGLLFAPAGNGAFLEAMAAAMRDVRPGRMLNDPTYAAFQEEVTRRQGDARLALLAAAESGGDGLAAPALFRVAAAELDADLLEECFGPSALVIEYRDDDELIAALSRLGGQLTATIHALDEETETVRRLHDVLRSRAGRLVFGGYPTGVAVAWATNHGGPYPAATSAHSSVGATSIRRWLRPIGYQDAPPAVLPAELQDANPERIPRRVNGVMTTDDV